MKTHDQRYWRTSDPYLAAFLFARGAIIVGIQACPGKMTFSFQDSGDRERWCDEYRARRASVNVRIYVAALEMLRRNAVEDLMLSQKDVS